MPNPYTGVDNDPIQQAQHRFTGPEWEKYFAALNGKNVRMVLGPSLGSMQRDDPGVGGAGWDDSTAHGNAVNAYLGQMQDERRATEQQLRAQTAGADIATAQARGVAQQEQDQEQTSRALATGGTAPQPIAGGRRMYTTVAPDADAAPLSVQEKRENMLKMMPGPMRAIYQAQWQKEDQASAAIDATKAKTELDLSKASGALADDDVVQAVSGMKEGSVPPQLPGRASKDYTKIMAEARRQGYDLSTAATDWTATQKHIQTMNGAQQLRLNQAINSLPDMLDSVDTLATQWKAGKFPVLNKANLALAKGGAYGKEAASVANQLEAQIADVTADLGNVYMGGNSPTDHALGLAAKSLSANWDEKVLHDMVGMAKKNVQIRQNSIKNTGVAGASANNLYGNQPAVAPTAAPSGAVEEWTRDAKGKLVKKGKG